MIDLNKEYATRDGLKVKLLAIFENNIFGAIETDSEWWEAKWDLNGKNNCSPEFSLVEMIPIIEHSAWINIYKSGISLYTFADRDAADWEALEDRIDCIEIKYSNKNL